MFGSSKKHIIFSPSTYGNNRHRRRTPRWLIIFLFGVVVGSVGLWFLQTNYAPQTLSLEEAQRLRQNLLNVQQEKTHLEQQLLAANTSLNEAQQTIQKLQPIKIATNENPTTSAPSTEQSFSPSEGKENLSIASILNDLPEDPNNTPIGIRIADFTSGLGELGYDIIFSKREANDPNIPIKINMFTTGNYRNGNAGFDYLEPITTTSDNYFRLQGNVKLSKPTLTPKKVEVNVLDAKNKTVLASRIFTIIPENERVDTPNENTLDQMDTHY